jgi:hypothetical protein
LARWIDPQLSSPAPVEPAEPETASLADQASFYAALSEQFAVRVLTGTYQMGSYLDSVEADEPDPARLEQLYRLDHAVSRTRRQAENLLVLAGRPVQDAGRQVTTLLDVIRASISAVEHYARVQVGRVAELAVVEFAADDLIRMLTELIDNGSRFSPPQSTVMVGAHMTETGSVLLRVEDSGFGIEPAQLLSINAVLATQTPQREFVVGTGHLGFSVIHRLAILHGLRVQLSNRLPGGVTATVLVPPRLLCEIPAGRVTRDPLRPATIGPPPASIGAAALVPPPRRPAEDVDPELSAAGLPMRRPVSLRATQPAPPKPVLPGAGRHRSAWPDDAADFAAGIEDARFSVDSTTEGSPR